MTELTVPGVEAPLRAEVFSPAGNGPWPAVVVLSEIWGLNDDIRRISKRFSDRGYLAVAPDLYRGRSTLRCMFRAIQSLRSGLGAEVSDLQALVEAVGARIDVRAVGVVGFCMGGGYALLLGTTTRATVAGVYYGELSSRTDWDALCPVVGGYGARDLPMRSGYRRLERELRTRGVAHDVVMYPSAGHSFMNHPPRWAEVISWPVMRVGHVPEAAEDSWTRMLAFFATHLDPDRR